MSLINYSDFKNDIKFTKPTESDKSKGQLWGFADKKIRIQSPWFNNTKGGIPRLNEKTKNFFPEEKDRLHIRTFEDPTNPECVEFFSKFKEWDELHGSVEKKTEYFGEKKGKKMLYNPIVKIPVVDDDDEDNEKLKKKEPSQAYIKFKFDTTWPDNAIKTVFYDSELNPDTNKRTRTKIEDINNSEDAANAVPYNCRYRLQFQFIKLWSQSPNKNDSSYGYTIKVFAIEVENHNKQVKFNYDADNFIDSDNESDLPKVSKLNTSISNLDANINDDKENEIQEAEEIKEASILLRDAIEISISEQTNDEQDDIKPKGKKPIAKSKK